MHNINIKSDAIINVIWNKNDSNTMDNITEIMTNELSNHGKIISIKVGWKMSKITIAFDSTNMANWAETALQYQYRNSIFICKPGEIKPAIKIMTIPIQDMKDEEILKQLVQENKWKKPNELQIMSKYNVMAVRNITYFKMLHSRSSIYSNVCLVAALDIMQTYATTNSQRVKYVPRITNQKPVKINIIWHC